MSNQSSLDQDNRKFAFKLIEQMEKNTGIKICELFEGDRAAADIRTELRKRVIAYVQERIGKDEPSEEWPHAGEVQDAKEALGLTDDITVVPNVAVLESNYAVLKGYEGQAQADHVKRIASGLALIQDGQSAGQVAGEIIGAGLASFAVAMIVGTVKAMRGGAVFRAALVTGVRAMAGVSVIVGTAVLIIGEILLYLLLENKKQFLGIVYNNTDLNLVVDNWRTGSGDLYVATGAVSSWMEQHENEQYSSPLVQIGARQIIAPNDPDNLILGGLFFGEKNNSLFGTEGTMVFHDRVTKFPRFPLLFACPYTMDNGVNVAIDTKQRSAKEAFDSLYDDRGLYKRVDAEGYTFTARTAFETGGETTGIMYLDRTVLKDDGTEPIAGRCWIVYYLFRVCGSWKRWLWQMGS
ncbi:hypothetical protein P171DRAFT_516711 [Karstenula rhodostoma CBS 690.94]|uniref:Uncharacterized protein n=1 Tax=Karstenula rhodostoma CBS 690.94 TaxID=1392251 RepID=A0A9P4UGC5_9PLEO|nr:hypothetical protein P171DRAFT_516711 [Karstenula rhodostoma CBS 690.94]